MLVAGFVLAGGRSSRMGRDKALLPVGSHTLIEEVASAVRNITGSVTLIGNEGKFSDLGFDWLDDLHPALGPLSGVETALASRRAAASLIVSCDMPGLNPAWLQALVERAKISTAHCLVCRDAAGRIHPLCGLWKQACLETVAERIRQRSLRMFEILRELDAEPVDIAGVIRNVNTPEDWTRWQSEAPLAIHGV